MNFQSEPFADFSHAAQREQLARAIDLAQRELGTSFPLLIDGREAAASDTLRSINPAHPQQLIGTVASAGLQDLERAVQTAERTQRTWQRTAVAARVALLRKTAQLIRRERSRLTALEILETGKPWREADADVVEAIEYLDYYSACMEDLAAGKPLLQRPGESNQYRYVARGVCAVIAPWNFPLAILAGMASAALATGNAVIIKPAEQSPVLAYHLVRLLHEAGVPPEVVQYLPGVGETIGAGLVRHPAVRVIMFTGSRAVGLSILAAAAQVPRGQRFVKHVVTEMGGKNAMILDDDADVDAAVKGILVSAFGYQGQKCSAASRLIVLGPIYDRVVERLVEAMDDLLVQDPVLPTCDLGPLIDAPAQQRVAEAITRGALLATLRYRYPQARVPHEGYFVGPAVFMDVERTSFLAQEELFGPVLSVFRVNTFEDALTLANDTDYALTGGVYSRSPAHLQLAADEFEAGNLYFNRPITGAIVGRQPFGGYKLSGLGTKAGGPDYLLQLLIPKTICENTARHGMPLE